MQRVTLISGEAKSRKGDGREGWGEWLQRDPSSVCHLLGAEGWLPGGTRAEVESSSRTVSLDSEADEGLLERAGGPPHSNHQRTFKPFSGTV